MIIKTISTKNAFGIRDLNINVSKMKLTLYNPIFLFSYAICFFKAILTKNVEWKAIPHTKELKLEK